MTDSNEVQIIALANYRLVSRPSQLNSSSSISTLTLTTLKRERENWMMSLNPNSKAASSQNLVVLKKWTFKLPRKFNQSWTCQNCHEIIRTNRFSAPSSSKPYWSSTVHSSNLWLKATLIHFKPFFLSFWAKLTFPSEPRLISSIRTYLDH